MNNVDGEQRETASSPDQTIFSLLHAAHALEDWLEETLTAVGLSIAKFGLLSQLVAAGRPLSLGELAAKLSCVKSNMTQLVDRLEADGFVRRESDPKDRRAVLASISDAGRERQRAGAVEVAKLHEQFSARVGVVDQAAVERMLTALG